MIPLCIFFLCDVIKKMRQKITLSCKEASVKKKWKSTSYNEKKITSTRQATVIWVNTTARRTNQQYMYVTVQVTAPKLQAQVPESSAREP